MNEQIKRPPLDFPGTGVRILASLCCLVTSAHFMRYSMDILTGIFLGSMILPWISSWWAQKALAWGLAAAAAVWLAVAHELYLIRLAHGAPWIRMIIILLSVVVMHLAAFWLIVRRIGWKNREASGQNMKLTVFFLSIAILVLLEVNSPVTLLLGSRFYRPLGGIEAIILGCWGVWIAGRLSDRKRAVRTRLLIWRVFSLVFFLQFALGVCGYEIFLMTGKWHIPVPGVIIAGPVFRGGGWVMIMILAVSLLLAGTAWCSHLCYFGALDHVAARRARGVSEMPGMVRYLRPVVFAGVVFVALSLRFAGVGWPVAVLLGCVLGLIMVPLALFVSRKKGIPVYCRHICPLGLLVKFLGRLSPWRVAVSSACNGCSACMTECRHGALSRHGGVCRVGWGCTLCRDCFKACSKGALNMNYTWGLTRGKSGTTTEKTEQSFVVLITIMHVVFLGIARI